MTFGTCVNLEIRGLVEYGRWGPVSGNVLPIGKDKNMIDLPTRENLRDLMAKETEACISIYMPTFRAGRKTEQGPIRLKNLLKQAEQYLLDLHFRNPQIRTLLEPAEALLTTGLFWQHQSDGLALFLSPAGLLSYRVPLSFDELVVVSKRFHLKPLFQLLTGDGLFFVLAISQNAVRLLECTRYGCDTIDLAGIPTSIAQALQFDDPEKQLQFHTGTSAPDAGRGRSAIFHGHGAGSDDAKTNLLRYFRSIDQGLQKLFQDRQAPLVLAGVEYLLPIYREANHYPYLIEEAIEGNPEELSDKTLQEQAWNLMEPIFRQAQDKARMDYERLSKSKSNWSSRDLEKIVSASLAGRVETLFVAMGVQQWGRFDPQTGTAQLHEEARPGDEDLLDLAAIQTFLNGGTVYARDPNEMPDDSQAAAIFRY